MKNEVKFNIDWKWFEEMSTLQKIAIISLGVLVIGAMGQLLILIGFIGIIIAAIMYYKQKNDISKEKN